MEMDLDEVLDRTPDRIEEGEFGLGHRDWLQGAGGAEDHPAAHLEVVEFGEIQCDALAGASLG